VSAKQVSSKGFDANPELTFDLGSNKGKKIEREHSALKRRGEGDWSRRRKTGELPVSGEIMGEKAEAWKKKSRQSAVMDLRSLGVRATQTIGGKERKTFLRRKPQGHEVRT